ncbi:MAG: hypothetical protein NC483_07815 [Ruminococcus sp.]|nr:hypothetical protein [Ruminococcus sp.]
MIRTQDEILEAVEEELAQATHFTITLRQLDSCIVKRLNVPSVFDDGDSKILALKNCQLLCYYLSIKSDKVYHNTILVVNVRIDIDNTPNIKNDLSNCLLDDEILCCDIFDLDNREDKERFDSYTRYAVMLTNDIEAELEKDIYKDNENLRKEVLKNYVDNGILEPKKA